MIVNTTECALPIARLQNGYYLFGTLKIFAKMMSGKLVAKSGNTYMAFEEFLRLKSDAELAKIAELVEKKEWD